MRNGDQDNSAVQEPKILDYLDYRPYIRDKLAHMQAKDAKYSQRWLAKRANFQSPHLLSMIIAGKRSLSKDKVEQLAKALKLNHWETEYFGIIVDLSHSDDAEVRKNLLNRIRISFQTGLFSSLDDDGLEIFREWYIPAIRELVSLKDFQLSPAWIAEMLGIEAAEAEDALKLLIDKGFVEMTDSTLKRSEPSIHNHKKYYPMIINKYHMQMVEKSFKAMPLSVEKRYAECLTFAMPRRLMPHLREAIRRFFREIDTLVESHDGREEVYQLNVQLFPLTVTAYGKEESTREKSL
ncbi:MAG: TIGR02147 family protein [Oligoflexales bacterium]